MVDKKPTLDEKLRDNRALIAEVQRLTVERDRARDIAVALEQQTAEALRIARKAIADDYRNSGIYAGIYACEEIARLLGDDEMTETPK